MKSCEFKTSEASTKAWMRTNGAIDKFLNIIDENIFRKSNKKFSAFAEKNYGTKGKLFLEENNKAIPNTALFQAIDKAKGFSYAQEKSQLNGDYLEEDMNTFAQKIELLQENMNVDVILDSDVETSRVLGSNDPRTIAAGKPVILINPAKIFKTTAIHEFSHIFIDSFPKGLANPRLQKGLSSLRGTKLWSEVEALYPDLMEDDLHKEILATAIGRKGSEIWDERTSAETKSTWESFRNWVMDYLHRTFGLESYAIESLTKELLDERVNQDLLENLNDQSMEERVGKFINEETGVETKIETSLESVYEQVQARISIIFEQHKPVGLAEKAKETERKVKAHAKNEMTPFEKIEELKNLLEKYSTTSQINGLLKYNKWSKYQIKLMRNRVAKLKKGDKMTPEVIAELKEYNSAFGLLDEIETMIISLHDRGEISDGRKKTFVTELASINAERESVNKELLTAQRQIYARILMQNSNEHEQEYLEHYGKLWERTQPQEAKTVWVIKQMEINKESIDNAAFNFYLGMAEKSIKDISMFSGVFANEKNISSTEIQVISRIADAADMETSGYIQSKAAAIKSHYDEFTKTHNESSMEKKYGDFIEQNAKGESSLVGKYLPEFHQQYFEIAKMANDPDQYNEHFKDVTWNGLDYTLNGVTKTLVLDKNIKKVTIVGEFMEYEIRGIKYNMPIKESLAKNELREWIKNNTQEVDYGEGISIEPHDKWLSPKYASMSKEDFKQLNIFKKMIEEADELYESKTSLISDVFGSKVYMLPGVTKSSMERLTEGKVGGAVVDRLTDMFRRKEDEFEIGAANEQDKNFKKVFADVTNKEKLNVPVPYRSRLDIKEQSFDLHSILLMNLEGAKNYEQKKKIEASINTIIDVMGKRMVPDYDGLTGLAKVHGFSGVKRIQVNKNIDEMPNDVKKAISMAENRIYGIKEKNAGEIHGVNVQKAMSTYMGYASNVSLVGNYLNSIVNATSGSISNIIEAIGGETYNMGDWKQAKVNYWSDARSIITDVGSNVETSKTNLLMNYFNVMGSATALNNKFSDTNKVKSLMSLHSLRVLDHGGEHMMQGQTMYAVLNSIKALNKKGEFINTEGKVVATEKEAAPMDKMIEFIPDGKGGVKLQLKSFVEATTFSPLGGGSDKILLDIRGLIKKKTVDLYGVYDESIKAAAQREWWGKLLFFLKKWIEPSATRRLRGVSKAFVASDDLKETDRYYSEDLKQYQEGYYTTAARFIAQLVKSGKGFQLEMISANFSKMNKHEKANMKRMAAEIGMISLTLLAYAAAGGFDDEPDDETLMARYLLSKELSELTYFLNPREAIKLMSSPTAALGVVNRNLAVISQLTDPTETYESGINKGRNKFYVKLRKSTPFIASFLEKDLETALRFQQNN